MLSEMKEFTLILSFCLLSLVALGRSFPEYPLGVMISHSEYIIKGEVFDINKTDSATRIKLLLETRKKSFGRSGICLDIAKIKVIRILKGELQIDTVLVPFNYDPINALPGFIKGGTVLLFLSKVDKTNWFIKTDARFGVKSNNIDLYIQKIIDYNNFLTEPDSMRPKLYLDWLVDLAETKELTWEGTEILKNLPDKMINQTMQRRLIEAILSFEKLERKDENLIDIVSRFGYNQEVFDLLIRNLKSLLDSDLYYLTSLDLMNGIYEMENQRKYKRLINRYYDTFTLSSSKKKEKQLEIIRKFIKKAVRN